MGSPMWIIFWGKLAKLQIVEAAFEDILPLWEQHLWPGRKSLILPTNPLCLDGTYLDELSSQEVYFWVSYKESRAVGGISLLRVRGREYRVRGVIVCPGETGRGVGGKLMELAITKAQELNADVLWSLPRNSVWPFYQKFGFEPVSDWIADEFEFGPNCFARWTKSRSLV